MLEYLTWQICPFISGVSKAASLRKIWGVPGSVMETSRMECGEGRIIVVVLDLLDSFVKCAHMILVPFFSTNELILGIFLPKVY